jgi:hypothetical protein
MTHKLQPNDLISVQPWDCEGIEQPWGWFPDDPPLSKNEPLTKKMKKFKKVRLSPGSTGIVIEQGNLVTDDYDEHYVVLVESKALSVPVRFLSHVD